ncbi:MAG: 6-phosphogluconolactonase [Acidobacteria bacterium]|nr:MAG: 6-phosphogluconolactonase [Acidobacteriota bacterium]PYY22091.1 MAG: 6-phosphogluconolactonase [Acidobacteriota bacterium]
MSKPSIHVLEDLQQVAAAATDEFVARAKRAISHHGRFTVALSGGSTPKTMHSILAERSAKNPKLVDWSRVQILFGDERHVPPDHADSNYRMAKETLLSKVPIPAANIHRIHTENPDAAKAAGEYDRELVKVFQLKGDDQLPRFDLIFLGMGPDGHTASLFPGTTAVHELKKRVVANWVPKFNTWRVTFTRPVINQAECVLLMVCGKDKAQPFSEVIGQGSPDVYPVKYVQPTHGELIWLVDRAAAATLAPATK